MNPKNVLAGVVAVLMALCFGVDVSTSKEVSVWVLYLVPVVICCWVFGLWAGELLCAGCFLLWLLDGWLTGYQHPTFGLFFLSVLNVGVCFSFVAFLLCLLKTRVYALEKLAVYEESFEAVGFDPVSGYMPGAPGLDADRASKGRQGD